MAQLPYEPEALKALAVSDSGFVFDPRTGHSFSLNSTGIATLKGLREGRALSEITAQLRESFDGVGSVEDDVEVFLSMLREYGLMAPRAVSGSNQ